jgi:VRR-NUC domain
MASSSPSEHEIQQRIRLACGRGAVRLWRNNTGALVDQQGRFVRFGLCKGSSDLIGLRSIEIRPELVGQRLAQFVALEVKTAQGVLRPEQWAFLRLVQQLGGVAAPCRSVEEAEQLLGPAGHMPPGH